MLFVVVKRHPVRNFQFMEAVRDVRFSKKKVLIYKKISILLTAILGASLCLRIVKAFQF
jgi:hypothetical protein